MELFTTATLWKNYNRKSQDLDVTVIKQEDSGNCSIKYVYFNGDRCADGCPRIYARYSLSSRSNGAAVVLMNDVEDVFDNTYCDMLLEKGYNVLTIDYVGKRAAELYTVYPYSLRMSNYFEYPDTVLTLPDNPKESCWYVWATLMLRGITFLEAQPETTGRISVFGVKYGAFQTWKTVFVDKTPACGVALFNSGYLPGLKLDGIRQLQYNTCIDNMPYASEVNVPMLICAASNAKDDSIEYMSDLYNGIKDSNCVFSVAERRCNELNVAQLDNIGIFMGYYNLGINTMPEQPILSVRESEHGLYYDIKADESLPIEDVKLYVSQGDMPFAYRNWHIQPVTPVSDGIYIARVNVSVPKEQICAFVTAKYKGTISASSELLSNVPFLLNVYATPAGKSPLLYSVNDGLDDWTVLRSGDGITCDPIVSEGAYGIKGITSPYNSLTTFKFGEFKYRFDNKTFMQVTAYVEGDVHIKINITVKMGQEFVDFIYAKRVVGYKEWVKINLTPDEFRGGGTRLENFGNISCFTIESDATLLINSIIMV